MNCLYLLEEFFKNKNHYFSFFSPPFARLFNYEVCSTFDPSKAAAKVIDWRAVQDSEDQVYLSLKKVDVSANVN